MNGIDCPGCGAGLAADINRGACPSCGLMLSGPDAGRLWEVDQQLAALTTERRALLERLRSGTAPKAPVQAGPPPARTTATPGRSVQRVLLGLGGLLVLVASAVFLAVAWSVIGVAGQALVMLVVTAAAAALCLRQARRGLNGTAETLGIVTTGLLLIDVTGARALGLAGLDRTDGRAVTVVAGVIIAAALIAMNRAAPHLRSLPTGATFVLSGAGFAVLQYLPDFSPAYSGTCLAIGAMFLAGHVATRRLRTDAVRTPLERALLRAGVVWTGIGAAIALSAAYSEPLPRNEIDVIGAPPLDDAVCALILVLLGALATLALPRLIELARREPVPPTAHPAAEGEPDSLGTQWRRGWLTPRWLPVSVTAALAAVCLPGGIAAIGWQTGAPIAATTAVLAAVALFIVTRPRRSSSAGGVRWPAALIGFTGVAAVLTTDGWDDQLWRTVAAAATSAGSIALARNRPGTRRLAGPVAVLAAAWAVGAATSTSSPTVAAVSLMAVAVLAAVVATTRVERPEEPGVAVAAMLVALAALTEADLVGPLTTSLALAVVAVVLAGYATRPGRHQLAWLAAAAATAAAWLVLDSGRIADPEQPVEVYSLPAVLTLAAAGLWVRHRGSNGSWESAGPMLVAAFAPSTAVAVGQEPALRPLLVIVIGAAVVALAARHRHQAGCVVGAVAVAVTTVAQLAPYAVGLPRWLTIGAVGVALIVLGARYEKRLANAREITRWVAGLH